MVALLAGAVGLWTVRPGVTGGTGDPPAVSKPDLPRILAPAEAGTGVGEELVVPVAAHDGMLRPLPVEATDLPAGARFEDGRIVWRPDDAGEWTVRLRAENASGPTEQALVLQSRHPGHDAMVMGLGDSVASGHGLQNRDYLGGDGCWRDGGGAYPRRVFDRLTDEGRLGADARFSLVACSGAEVDDLLDSAVTGGPDGVAPAGTERLSQVEWAVRANPGVVTITVGANDLDFVDPASLLRDGGEVDETELVRRLDAIRSSLETVVDRLVTATDARVVLTTYHDPAPENPQGIDGCRGACFRTAVDHVLGSLNDTIASVAASQGLAADGATARVVVADLSGRFDGHGAPNGLGPDDWRAGGVELADVLDLPPIGTSAYCARGHGGDDDPWVNPVDCVHPNEAGARAYADAVVEALTT